MMPSREHFLLNLLSALSTDSFSPTLIVDMFFLPSFACAVIFEMLNNYTKRRRISQLKLPVCLKKIFVFSAADAFPPQRGKEATKRLFFSPDFPSPEMNKCH